MNLGSTLSQAWKLSRFAQSARAKHEDLGNRRARQCCGEGVSASH